MGRGLSSALKMLLIGLAIFTCLTQISVAERDGPGQVSPNYIFVDSGDNQSGAAGMPLPEKLVVKTLDWGNRPMAGARVKFTVVKGDGVLTRNVQTDPKGQESIAVTTNSLGKAGAILILGKKLVENEVKAEAGDLKPVNFIAAAVNSPPEFGEIGDKLVKEANVLNFTVTATDADPDDTVTLSADALPTNASFVSSTDNFTFSPDYTQAGTYEITFYATDGSLTVSKTITITVTNVNRLPTLSPIQGYAIDEGSELIISILATDPDNDPLTFYATNMPPGAVMEHESGAHSATFKWTPGPDTVTSGDALDFDMVFIVSDIHGGSDSQQMTITVLDVKPPSVPDIMVAPLDLEFGVVEMGRSADRVFLIYNEGDADLKISGIIPTSPHFAILAYSKTDGQFVALKYSEADDRFIVVKYPETDPRYATLAYSQASDTFIIVTYSQSNPWSTIPDYSQIDGHYLVMDNSQVDPETKLPPYPADSPLITSAISNKINSNFLIVDYDENDPDSVNITFPT